MLVEHQTSCESSSLRRHESAVAHWLFERAWPYWCEVGVEPCGLAYEACDFDGTPLETGYRRTMVQFRQVYVLAQAALLGRCDPALATGLFQRVTARAWLAAGGWVHRLTPAGHVADSTRDAYDHAFALLACAWIHELTGCREALSRADETLAFLDREMAAAHGGYLEAIPARAPRRQNPHMHLFEALLALYETTGRRSYLERADAVLRLIVSRFVLPNGGLREFLDTDLSPLCAHESAVEPGHHFEWIWLLYERARLGPSEPDALIGNLLSFATLHGLDARGLPFEQLAEDGTVRVANVKLWALSEQLKAMVVHAEHTGAQVDEAIDVLMSVLFHSCLAPAPQSPIWYETISPTGDRATDRMPASTLYHLTLSFTEFLRWRGAIERSLGRRRCA